MAKEHPTVYANMLGEKMEKENVNVWLINTGWSGGTYGIGSRIKLKYTRTMIAAVINNKIEDNYLKHDIFGLNMIQNCSKVPKNILNPINTWNNKSEYIETAKKLANLFHKNFTKIKVSINTKSMLEPNNLKDIELGGPITKI